MTAFKMFGLDFKILNPEKDICVDCIGNVWLTF